MTLTNIVGTLAAFTSTVSLVPQIYRTYQLKSSHDISWGMLVNFTLAGIFWILYGLMIDGWAIWMANIVGLVFSLILVVMKYCYDH